LALGIENEQHRPGIAGAAGAHDGEKRVVAATQLGGDTFGSVIGIE
jgi:hypothetical protein